MSKINYVATIAMAVSAALFYAEVSCAQQNMDGYIVAPTPVNNVNASHGYPAQDHNAVHNHAHGTHVQGGHVQGGHVHGAVQNNAVQNNMPVEGYTGSGYPAGNYEGVPVEGAVAHGGYVDNGQFANGGCPDGSCGSFGYADDGCAGGGCGAGGRLFGWGQGGCGGCAGCRSGSGCRIMSDGFHQGWAHMKEVNQRVMARNQAWPKPFDCADRQLYFAMFEPMIETGMSDMCTLSAAHFDRHSNELNSLGESAVASIMQNMPSSRKNIYIQQDSNSNISDSRMASVRNTVERWYGHVPAPGIAFTNRYPMTHSGARVELVNSAYAQEIPPPVIAVGDSTQSTSDTGQ